MYLPSTWRNWPPVSPWVEVRVLSSIGPGVPDTLLIVIHAGAELVCTPAAVEHEVNGADRLAAGQRRVVHNGGSARGPNRGSTTHGDRLANELYRGRSGRLWLASVVSALRLSSR